MGLDAPAALMLHFCLVLSASRTQRCCLRLEWCLAGRKPKGGGSTVSAVRHGPSMLHGHCAPRGAWLLQVYSGTLKRVTTPCCDTFQSRGSRWLPRVIVPVLLAQRSKKTEGKIRKKHPDSSSLKLQTSLTYKCL